MSQSVLLVLLFVLTVGVGVLIGGIGIGGVLLVPMLTYLSGIEIHLAIGVAMFSYLFTGAIGATIYARRGSIRWPMAAWLCAGAMPAAFAGAWAANALPATALEVVIALFVMFSGANALRAGRGVPARAPCHPATKLVAIGAVTGAGSTMTGTGGPLILIPILLWLDVSALTAIGLAQAIQLPIAAFATVGNLAYGHFDLTLGLVVGAALAIGAFAGAHGAHRVPQAVLKRIVALVLIAIGLAIAGRIAYQFLY